MTPRTSPNHFGGSIAERYERDFVPAVAARVAPDLIDAADPRPGERVLDSGCGTGVVARLAAERIGRDGTVVGVDASEEMIGVARALPAPEGWAPIEWHVADAAALPVADDTIDVALSQMALMLTPDPGAVLRETRRVLAPEGRVALNTPGEVQPPFVVLGAALARHIDERLAGFVGAVFSMDDPDGLAHLLEEAGYREVEAGLRVTELRLPPPGELVRWYVGATPLAGPVGAAPEEARAALEDEVASRCRELADDGAITVRQPMVLATARA